MDKSPYFDINYGWPYGSDGWNAGMDLNLVTFSFLDRHAITEFVESVPEDAPEGYSCIEFPSAVAHFWVGSGFSTVELEDGYEFLTLTDSRYWRKVDGGYIELPSPLLLSQNIASLDQDIDELDSRVEDTENDIQNLQDSTGEIIGDASTLPVSSFDETLTLSEWMAYLRERSNHVGMQPVSTITNFSGEVLESVLEGVRSFSLELELDGEELVIEDPNSLGGESTVVGGILVIPSAGKWEVSLSENVTSVTLPEGKEGSSRVVEVVFRVLGETPLTVEGWEDVVWADGEEFRLSPPPLVSKVTLVNIDDRGWVGSYYSRTADNIFTTDEMSVQESLDSKVDKDGEKVLSTNDFTDELLDKLYGIQDSSTSNETDEYLMNRENHTGEQAISTVTGLQGELDSINLLLGDVGTALDLINGEVI